jgi:hypothetical protein
MARTPRAVLADVLDNNRAERTATADREAAELATRSSMTLHLDRLIDLSAQATAGRTVATLDQVAATGALSPTDRRALAADEARGGRRRQLTFSGEVGLVPPSIGRPEGRCHTTGRAASKCALAHPYCRRGLATHARPTAEPRTTVREPRLLPAQQQ